METTIRSYCDKDNNVIETVTELPNVKVVFQGKNNKLILSKETWISKGVIKFTGNNAVVKIGRNSKKKPHTLNIRVGEDSNILIGDGVTIEKNAALFACEGASIKIGDDCMISTNVQFRADDSHPVFNVNTDLRINLSRHIVVGDHCWIGFGAVILKGCNIGIGSVIGMGSVVTKNIPNNCIAVGMPARVVKKDIAWERPNLATTLPAYKLCSNDVSSSKKYWAKTERNLDENIKEYFENEKWSLIISEGKNCIDTLNDQSKYYFANALFYEGQYKQALRILLNIDCGLLDFRSRSLIGKVVTNIYFKLGLYYFAAKNSQQCLLNNSFDKSLFVIYIISSLMCKECINKFIINDMVLLNGKDWVDNCKNEIIAYLKKQFNDKFDIYLDNIF